MGIRLTLLAAALFSATLVSAQEAPALLGRFKPKVGSWAEYDYNRSGGKRPMKGHFRAAVVGKEGDAYWIELKFKPEVAPSTATHAMGDAIMKMLLGKDTTMPKRVIIKMSRGIIELPPRPSNTPKEADFKAEGQEKKKVAAGTFDTTILGLKNDKRTTRVWVKDGIGPWGVVYQKTTLADGEESTMSLLALGDDAKPEVDVSQAKKLMPPMMSGTQGGPRNGSLSGSMPNTNGMTPQMSEMIKRAMQNRAQQQGQAPAPGQTAPAPPPPATSQPSGN